MSKIIAKKDVYLNADKDRAVKDGDADAAYLLARAGRQIPPQYEDLVTAAGAPKAVKKESPKAADKGGKKPANKGAKK